MPTPSPSRFTPTCPWRSAPCGWVVAVAALVYGVPLFLCMPPWNDVTLHDMAVRSMLRGGVHYRDLFDTNLPGIDWAMAAVRLAFGWSYEALRAVDLVVIAAEVVLLLGWARRAGGGAETVAWLAASAALFYPFTSEFNHIQRDPWLLLPALAAARMRLSRTVRPPTDEAEPSLEASHIPFLRAIPEGLLWGAAVWVKPHVVIPAGAIWVSSVVIRAHRESWRSIRQDFFGLLAGGLAAGALGIAWLVGTGAWPYFLDVFLNWNPSYLQDMWDEAPGRFERTFRCFLPWSFVHFAALPLAILALVEASRFWRRAERPGRARFVEWIYSPAATDSVSTGRALLGALYLGWFAQAVFLQKGFDYVQVPLTLLAMGVVAAQRWAFGFVFLCWFGFLAALTNGPGLSGLARTAEPYLAYARPEQDPLTDPQLMRLWPRCWREGGSPELRDKLAWFTAVHCGTNWKELNRVAEFLRTLNPPLSAGELNCWHDSTHPLYLMLDLEPATRFMHYGTVFAIPNKRDVIGAEVAASRQRYVVSDLLRMTLDPARADDPGAGGDPLRLPMWFPLSQRQAFPWNQPIVFRSGRYLVHKVENPLGEIDVPDWRVLNDLGPGEP